MIDAYLVYIFFTGVIQFVYCVVVGRFPFNSFLAGFLSCVGSFVLTGMSCSKRSLNLKLPIIRFWDRHSETWNTLVLNATSFVDFHAACSESSDAFGSSQQKGMAFRVDGESICGLAFRKSCPPHGRSQLSRMRCGNKENICYGCEGR